MLNHGSPGATDRPTFLALPAMDEQELTAPANGAADMVDGSDPAADNSGLTASPQDNVGLTTNGGVSANGLSIEQFFMMIQQPNNLYVQLLAQQQIGGIIRKPSARSSIIFFLKSYWCGSNAKGMMVKFT